MEICLQWCKLLGSTYYKIQYQIPIQEAQKEVMITLFVWLWKDKWVSDEIWLAAFDLWMSIQGQQKATFYIKPIFMVIKWVEYKSRVAHFF